MGRNNARIALLVAVFCRLCVPASPAMGPGPSVHHNRLPGPLALQTAGITSFPREYERFCFSGSYLWIIDTDEDGLYRLTRNMLVPATNRHDIIGQDGPAAREETSER